jgi:uncharacterized protein (TIGR03790 family)
MLKSSAVRRARIAVLALLGLLVLDCLDVFATCTASASSTYGRLHHGLHASQLAVVVNTSDPLSIAIADYYVQRRGIPARNVARVAFDRDSTALAAEDFLRLKRQVDVQIPRTVQAYALTWSQPYQVDCMSITSAFAFGFDRSFCASGCRPTARSPYFNSDTDTPYDDFQLRPAMSIAAANLTQARALIDRGIRSDGSLPFGTAYLLRTGDRSRDVRAAGYPNPQLVAHGRVLIDVINAPSIIGRDDVLFYFTGAVQVPNLQTNHFLPGAVGDHLTSFGGRLTASGSQMSSLRWLEAGATGSYGTVVEPCNIPGKFPIPSVLMRHYLAGETLIEAYWKSVAMPGQGIFIGEPLAAPYRVLRTPITVAR